MASTVLDPGFHAGQPVDSQQAFQADDSQIYTSHPPFFPQVLSFISSYLLLCYHNISMFEASVLGLFLFLCSLFVLTSPSFCQFTHSKLWCHSSFSFTSYISSFARSCSFFSVISFISPLSVPLCIHVLFTAQTMVIVFQLFSCFYLFFLESVVYSTIRLIFLKKSISHGYCLCSGFNLNVTSFEAFLKVPIQNQIHIFLSFYSILYIVDFGVYHTVLELFDLKIIYFLKEQLLCDSFCIKFRNRQK